MRTDENSYLTDESEMMIIGWACCPEIRNGNSVHQPAFSSHLFPSFSWRNSSWSVVVVKYKKFQPYINILTHHPMREVRA